MITAVTPPPTAITTITNVDNPFVSMLLRSTVPGTLDGLVTFCDPVVEAIDVLGCVVADEALIVTVVESMKFTENVAIRGTKEETGV